MSFKINHESWPAAHCRLCLCTEFTIIINAQIASEGNGAKVIQLSAYLYQNQRAFIEASNN